MTSDGRGAQCVYCATTLTATTSRGPTAAVREHVKPKSQGGEYRRWACRGCDRDKKAMSIEEWEDFIVQNPRRFRRSSLARAIIGVRSGRVGPISLTPEPARENEENPS